MNIAQTVLTYTFLVMFSLLIAFMHALNAFSLNIGQRVDVDLNIFSDKDLALFHRGVKEDCTYLGKDGEFYVFQYDNDKIMIPFNSIKMIILK